MISPEMLRRFPFFGGLNEDQLRGIAMIADEVSYAKGDLVFEGDTHAEIFNVVAAGEVELLYNGGRETGMSDAYVGSVASGEVVGVSALIEPFKYITSARAENPTTVIAINGPALLALCQVDQRLGFLIMSKLVKAVYERLHSARIQLAVSKPA
jgi:CRP/FNR family transcriptional regulator, cyclic AMP receptor protein